MTPSWILDILAAVMLVVAAVSAARLALTRSWRPSASGPDIDVAHLLMAIAMAGMLVANLSTLPSPAWDAVFGLLTAWFALRVVLDARANGATALAGGHCAPHLAHSAAMLYVFLAMVMPAAGTGGMSGMGGMPGGAGSAIMTLDYPTLAFVFALVLIGYSVWDIDQLSAARYRIPARIALAGVGGTEVTGAGSPEADADRTAAPAGAGAGSGARDILLSPGVTVGCRIAMGVVMVFMLLIAL